MSKACKQTDVWRSSSKETRLLIWISISLLICCFLSCWCLLFQIIYKHETMDLNVISLSCWFLYWSQSICYHWKHPSKHPLKQVKASFVICAINWLIFFFERGEVSIHTIVTLRKFQCNSSFSNNLSLITENSQNSRKRWRWWRFLPSDTEGWWGKRAESEILYD